MATLDELSQHRNWFRGDPDLPFTPLVEAYMADEIDLPTTVSKIVQPVNEAYSSGDASAFPPGNGLHQFMTEAKLTKR